MHEAPGHRPTFVASVKCEVTLDEPPGGELPVAHPEGFGFDPFCHQPPRTHPGQQLLIARHTPLPVASNLGEFPHPLLEVERPKSRDQLGVRDLMNVKQGGELLPPDDGLSAERDRHCRVDALEVGHERFQHGGQRGFPDRGNPPNDAVELFITPLAAEEAEEIQRNFRVFGSAGNGKRKRRGGSFISGAFQDGPKIGVIRGGQREIHHAHFEHPARLLHQAAGVPRAGGDEHGALLGKQKHRFIAAQSGKALLKLLGELPDHLEAGGKRRKLKVNPTGFHPHKQLDVAHRAVTVEIHFAYRAKGRGFAMKSSHIVTWYCEAAMGR